MPEPSRAGFCVFSLFSLLKMATGRKANVRLSLLFLSFLFAFRFFSFAVPPELKFFYFRHVFLQKSIGFCLSRIFHSKSHPKKFMTSLGNTALLFRSALVWRIPWVLLMFFFSFAFVFSSGDTAETRGSAFVIYEDIYDAKVCFDSRLYFVILPTFSLTQYVP